MLKKLTNKTKKVKCQKCDKNTSDLYLLKPKYLKEHKISSTKIIMMFILISKVLL